MYSLETHRFSDSSEMMDYLKTIRPSVQGDPIGIVGGHYMLLYDKKEDCLKPVIHQDLEDPKLKNFAKLMAEDFPVNSFVSSVQLAKLFEKKKISSKIILIVNDHIFQSKNFQGFEKELIKGRGGILRRKYYEDNLVPDTFQKIINSYNADINYIYQNNNLDRKDSALLPKHSYFFSEQRLRKRFDRRTRFEMAKSENFLINEIEGSKELFYLSPTGSQICLSQNGSCGCSEEVIEFLLDLKNKGFKDIIFFVPLECLEAVKLGVKAFFYYNNNFNISISLISGLENYTNITCNHFKFKDTG